MNLLMAILQAAGWLYAGASANVVSDGLGCKLRSGIEYALDIQEEGRTDLLRTVVNASVDEGVCVWLLEGEEAFIRNSDRARGSKGIYYVLRLSDGESYWIPTSHLAAKEE